MVEYLSSQWLAAADEALRSDEELQTTAGDIDLVIDQVVTRVEGEDIRYHMRFGNGVRLLPGPAPKPDVSYRQTYEVAIAIAAGRDSAQMAFMRGDLVVGGDVRAMLPHRALLDRLTDSLAALRADTRFDPPPT